MRSLKEEQAAATIDAAYRDNLWSKMFALVSGGHDSLAAATVAAEHHTFAGVAHINTGTGIEDTTDFVRQVCADRGWPFVELRTPPAVYESYVLRHGFPQPHDHPYVYSLLKERRVDQLVREQKRLHNKFDRIGLVTGLRRDESQRRAAKIDQWGVVRREGAQVWVAPITDWTKLDCADQLEQAGVPRNPVVDLLHKSGECLCGCYARPSDLDDLALWYPRDADRIYRLQERVRDAGLAFSRWDFRYRSPGRRYLPVPASAADTLCTSCAALDADDQGITPTHIGSR